MTHWSWDSRSAELTSQPANMRHKGFSRMQEEHCAGRERCARRPSSLCMRRSTTGSSPMTRTRSFHGGITTQGAGGPDKRKPFKSSTTEKRGVNPAASTPSARVGAGAENRAAAIPLRSPVFGRFTSLCPQADTHLQIV